MRNVRTLFIASAAAAAVALGGTAAYAASGTPQYRPAPAFKIHYKGHNPPQPVQDGLRCVIDIAGELYPPAKLLSLALDVYDISELWQQYGDRPPAYALAHIVQLLHELPLPLWSCVWLIGGEGFSSPAPGPTSSPTERTSAPPSSPPPSPTTRPTSPAPTAPTPTPPFYTLGG